MVSLRAKGTRHELPVVDQAFTMEHFKHNATDKSDPKGETVAMGWAARRSRDANGFSDH
jgi:hypothetical protein